MTNSKIILACLNGGLSLGLIDSRVYLSKVMQRASKGSAKERHLATKYRWARGFVFPTPSQFYRRSVRGVINFAREHVQAGNRLILLGKSAGAHNWITHLNEHPDVFNAYDYVGALFVDTNIGPRAANHNRETLHIKAKLDDLIGLYTDDPGWGGYMVGNEEQNYLLKGRTHHNCVKHPEVYKSVRALITKAGYV